MQLRSTLAILIALVSARTRAEEPAKPLLPAHAVWVMRYDAKLDGVVTGRLESAVHWSLTVRNNHITGGLDGMKVGDPKDHRMAGEIAPGKPPILSTRQDGPNGLICYYTGKLLEPGRVVGTWFDNRGGSGDFEMTPEK